MSTLNAGTSFVGAALKVSTSPIINAQGGKAFDAAGAVVVRTTTPSPLFYVNGLPVDGSGATVVVDKAAAVAPLQNSNGLQYDANGRVVTVDVGVAAAPLAASGRLTFDASGALVTSA